MRKLFLLFVTTLFTLASFGQAKKNTQSAIIALRNGDISDAKKYIDEASNDAEGIKIYSPYWLWRGNVYAAIAADTSGLTTKLNAENAAEVALNAYLECMKMDDKKTYEDARKSGIASIALAFNKAIEYQQKSRFSDAIRVYELLMKMIPYDKDGEIKRTYNITENTIFQYCAYAAFDGKDYDAALKYLNKLADAKFNDPSVYLLMDKIYLEKGDTSKAIDALDKGRSLNPDNKDLINEELYVYSLLGKSDVLIKKLDGAIERDPENANLYFVRGVSFEKLSSVKMDAYRAARDSAESFKNKSAKEKDPNKKKVIDAAVKKFFEEAELALAESANFLTHAETDYKKVIELEPASFDGNFNLGALYFNRSIPLIDKMNDLNLPKQQKEYDELDKAAKVLFNQALEYFLKAEEAKPSDADVLLSIQQTYAQLRNEAKVIEYKKKRDSLK